MSANCDCLKTKRIENKGLYELIHDNMHVYETLLNTCDQIEYLISGSARLKALKNAQNIQSFYDNEWAKYEIKIRHQQIDEDFMKHQKLNNI